MPVQQWGQERRGHHVWAELSAKDGTAEEQLGTSQPSGAEAFLKDLFTDNSQALWFCLGTLSLILLESTEEGQSQVSIQISTPLTVETSWKD